MTFNYVLTAIIGLALAAWLGITVVDGVKASFANATQVISNI